MPEDPEEQPLIDNNNNTGKENGKEITDSQDISKHARSSNW